MTPDREKPLENLIEEAARDMLKQLHTSEVGDKSRLAQAIAHLAKAAQELKGGSVPVEGLSALVKQITKEQKDD